MEAEAYDAVVIGSGQGGTPLSLALARAGWKTAIVERGDIGGTCVNVGCTPTKTMVASARVAYLSRRSADYGVDGGPVTVSMSAVRRRKQKIVESFRGGGLKNIEKTPGLDLVKGEGSFNGPKTLEVTLSEGGTRLLTAKKIFINTGARPAKPRVPGLDTVPNLDSSSIMELESLPEHLLVLGGGYVGLEFGQMVRRFGSQGTIVHRGAQLLAREDGDVAEEVAKILREDGIEILLEATALHAEQGTSGKIQLTVGTPTAERTLTGSHLLVAAGRVPNTDGLNLAAIGVKTDKRGYIQVNEWLETHVPGIYALGASKRAPAFTHISYDDFRIIRANLLEGGDVTIKDRLVPYTIFIDPQLGRVGFSETEPQPHSRNIKVPKFPMNNVTSALHVH